MTGTNSLQRDGGYEDIYVKSPRRLADQIANPCPATCLA